jgi:hypothetical protein
VTPNINRCFVSRITKVVAAGESISFAVSCKEPQLKLGLKLSDLARSRSSFHTERQVASVDPRRFASREKSDCAVCSDGLGIKLKCPC